MTTPHPTKSAPAPAAVAPQNPPMPETWHVDVHVHGEKILSIGYDWLSGKGDLTESEEQAVVGMAQHLLSFVGYGLPQSGFDPDADEQAPAAQEDALNTIAAMFHSGEEIEGPDGLAVMVDMALWNEALDSFEGIIGDEMDVDPYMKTVHQGEK